VALERVQLLEHAQVVQLDEVVLGPRDQPAPVGVPCERLHHALVPIESAQLHAAPASHSFTCAPQPRDTAHAAAADREMALAHLWYDYTIAQQRAADLGLWGSGVGCAKGQGRPGKASRTCLTLAPRGDDGVVGVPRDCLDVPAVPAELHVLLEARKVPDLDGGVVGAGRELEVGTAEADAGARTPCERRGWTSSAEGCSASTWGGHTAQERVSTQCQYLGGSEITGASQHPAAPRGK